MSGWRPLIKGSVLEHDGFMLYETQAILRYLDRVLPAPPLTPADLKAAARMDQVMNVNDWYLIQGVGSVIGFHRVIGPRLMAAPSDRCSRSMTRASLLPARSATVRACRAQCC
jgi:glutathione S-transferase